MWVDIRPEYIYWILVLCWYQLHPLDESGKLVFLIFSLTCWAASILCSKVLSDFALIYCGTAVLCALLYSVETSCLFYVLTSLYHQHFRECLPIFQPLICLSIFSNFALKRSTFWLHVHCAPICYYSASSEISATPLSCESDRYVPCLHSFCCRSMRL